MAQPAAPDDSDPEDDDYKPGEASDEGGISGEKKENKSRKKRPSNNDALPRRRKGGIKLSDEEGGEDSEDDPKERRKETEEEEAERKAAREAKQKEDAQKQVDDIFEQMKRDAATPALPKAAESVPETKQYVTVTQTLEFAGESITVEKTVAADTIQPVKDKPAPPSRVPSLLQTAAAKPKPKGGLNQLLANLGGPKKISSLEKSSLDWQRYKQKEGLEDELAQHQKSGGYLEKQAFLQRADFKQFEIERDARNKMRKPPPTGGSGV